ncbi:MAG: glycosyltransferase family 2 protein [Deltaproteobacteria bacterium]|nr:glycosyltransferase family 2 protein [Deltaproteobacteria bacterium]MBW2361058.1 glycosyltransferase family 2 protein [Deltaproteobacteria bacterium]
MASSATPAAGAAPDSPLPQRLLVALPALDEERTVAAVVAGIPRSLPGVAAIEIVVVDDGSSDATAERAAAAGAHVIRHPTPRGVGAAFHSALAYGVDRGADLIVSIDADGQFDPADIPRLIQPVLDGSADFTTASRFADASLVPEMPAIKLWGNRMMSRLISRLAGQTFHDVSCGMRCYSRRAALQLYLVGRFTYTQEVVLNLAFKGVRIVEVPVRVRGEREFGESRVAGNLWRYGLRTAQIIFRAYRDYHPLRFFGGIGAALLVPALFLAGFLGWHYLATGGFTPHKWAGFVALGLVMVALLILQVGVIGDMLSRHRIYLEELLYRQRSDSRRDSSSD